MIARVLATLLVCAGVAHGQEPAASPTASDIVVYEADYFAEFAPRTALDMVRRTPGFSIAANEENRGFSGAIGNVLIDGEPPASKAQEIEDILERLPAADVVRIEVIRSAGANAASAHSVRLNIVRGAGAGDGVWRAEFEGGPRAALSPNVRSAWSGRRGAMEFGLAASFDRDEARADGRREARTATDALDSQAAEGVREVERETRLSGEVAAPLAGGRVSVTSQFSRVENEERLGGRVLAPTGGLAEIETAEVREREDVFEIGGSYKRAFGEWETEFGGILTRGRARGDETGATFDAEGAFDEAERETRRIESGETIVRAGAARALPGRARLEIGAEGAFNTLEQRLELTEDEGQGEVPVPLPSANVRVVETRGEAFATLSIAPNARWTLDAGAAVEASRLRQSGDASQETELVYWKPSVGAARKIGDDDQVRLRFYRDVGQLDFEDFVARAEIVDSTAAAGNPDMRPQTSWRIEAAADLRFENEGAFDLTLFYWRMEDALDFIVVGAPGAFFDARGNIGDAHLFGARFSLELPLAFMRGARLRAEGSWQDSEAADPQGGRARELSGIEESALTLEFRHDLPAWKVAWGASFERERATPEFRLDRISRELEADEFELWVETTHLRDIKIRMFAADFGATERRDRTFFDPDRTGAFVGGDRRVRRFDPIVGLSAEGRF